MRDWTLIKTYFNTKSTPETQLSLGFNSIAYLRLSINRVLVDGNASQVRLTPDLIFFLILFNLQYLPHLILSSETQTQNFL